MYLLSAHSILTFRSVTSEKETTAWQTENNGFPLKVSSLHSIIWSISKRKGDIQPSIFSGKNIPYIALSWNEIFSKSCVIIIVLVSWYNTAPTKFMFSMVALTCFGILIIYIIMPMNRTASFCHTTMASLKWVRITLMFSLIIYIPPTHQYYRVLSFILPLLRVVIPVPVIHSLVSLSCFRPDSRRFSGLSSRSTLLHSLYSARHPILPSLCFSIRPRWLQLCRWTFISCRYSLSSCSAKC